MTGGASGMRRDQAGRPMAALVLVGLLSVHAHCGSLPGPPAPTTYSLIDAFAYDDSEAAGQAWVPSSESAPPVPVAVSGQRALCFPCRFAATQPDRCYWDFRVSLDLALADGVEFRFYCPDTSPVERFNLYFHSNPGWYTATFAPNRSAAWDTVVVRKVDMGVEGMPGGWRAVDIIRIAAWRAANTDTAFYLADLRVRRSNSSIAVIEADSARGTASEARAVESYTGNVCNALGSLGLPYVLMSDLDVTPARLAAIKIAVLPYNPSFAAGASEALAGYMGSGGSVVSFYTLDDRLAPAMGMRLGKHVAQEYSGYFASIRPSASPLEGVPPVVEQQSWNIVTAAPAGDRAKIAAYWHNQDGASTGYPAIVASDKGVHMTHVLLGDDPQHKQQMFLAMINRLDPQAATRCAAGYIDRIGVAGPYTSLAALGKAVHASQGNPSAAAALESANALRERAVAFAAEGKPFDAITAAQRAQHDALRAYCGIQPSCPNEHRAFWCHDAFGVAGMTWDEAVGVLAENGFNVVLPNMAWAGTAYYPSDVLPEAPQLHVPGQPAVNPLEECLAACRKHGVECHFWKITWNMGTRAAAEFRARMAREGRIQRRFDGKPEKDWLCPSDPRNRQLEIDALVEVANRYPVDGVHFDYIRYPSKETCFCDGCRRRFEEACGVKVARWPQDVREKPDLHARWLEFRRKQTTTLVADVSKRVRAVRPGIEVSAAVFKNWPLNRDSIGQDWKHWCDEGYLDFVCPMDYTPSLGPFEDLVKRQVEWAGSVPCYPGIGLSTWDDPTDVCRLIDQIHVTRRHKSGGFTVFNLGPTETKAVLPLCGLGITRSR